MSDALAGGAIGLGVAYITIESLQRATNSRLTRWILIHLQHSQDLAGGIGGPLANRGERAKTG